MSLPLLTARSRVMMFAPHPDDESLAAGVFLQRAVGAGAAVRIVYATDGERNCWPQRVLERKVRLRAQDRFRWGARRRAEALAALQSLGIGAEAVEFLALPDQGVTDLLLDGCHVTLRRLAAVIGEWQPTHVLLPSAADTHPDHSGLAVLLGIVLDHHLPAHPPIARLHYLVHGSSAAFERSSLELPHDLAEQKSKRRAIGCHITQVALSRRRFLSYAKRPERFLVARETAAPASDGPIHSFVRSHSELRLQVAFTLKPLRAEATTLYLLGHDRFGLRRLRTTLPGRSTRLDLVDCSTGDIACVGQYRGDAFRAEISLPLTNFLSNRSVFVKLDRRVWFFDEAGWLEIDALAMTPLRLPAPARITRELAVA